MRDPGGPKREQPTKAQIEKADSYFADQIEKGIKEKASWLSKRDVEWYQKYLEKRQLPEVRTLIGEEANDFIVKLMHHIGIQDGKLNLKWLQNREKVLQLSEAYRKASKTNDFNEAEELQKFLGLSKSEMNDAWHIAYDHYSVDQIYRPQLVQDIVDDAIRFRLNYPEFKEFIESIQAGKVKVGYPSL